MLVDVAIFVGITAAGIGDRGRDHGQRRRDAARRLAGARPVCGALVGIGHAVGGLIGTRFAATVVVVFVVVTWFVQLLGPLLGLPQVVRELALTTHFGQPMVGALGRGRHRGQPRAGDRRRGRRDVGLARRDLRG